MIITATQLVNQFPRRTVRLERSFSKYDVIRSLNSPNYKHVIGRFLGFDKVKRLEKTVEKGRVKNMTRERRQVNERERRDTRTKGVVSR